MDKQLNSDFVMFTQMERISDQTNSTSLADTKPVVETSSHVQDTWQGFTRNVSICKKGKLSILIVYNDQQKITDFYQDF